MSQSPAPSPSTSGLGCGTRREDAVPNDEHMSSKAKAGAADHLYWSKEKSNKPPPPLTAADAKAAKRENAVVSDKVWTPIFKWGQRKDKVVLTIFVPCLEEEAVQVDVKPKTLEFKADRVAAFAGDKKEQRVYTLSLKLCAEVDDSRAEIFIRHDHVRVELPKVSAKPWRTLQQAGIPKHPNERPDFDFVDGSDDEDDEVLCRPVPSGADRKRGGGGRSSGGGWLAYLRATSLIGAWEMPLFLVALGYVVLAPLTKVEESFGLQATHDLLFHQADLESYDHLEFPGVVPRSFLGPIFLALVSSPLVGGLGLAGQDKFASQYAVRGSLACASCACLTFLLRKVKAQYGRDTYRALVFVSLSQFHWLFYCSRTLPNTFASLLVTLATGFWVDGKVVPCLRLLTAAVVIFRSELVLLLGPLSLLFLYNRQIALPTLVWTGLSAACLSLLLTCTVDSIFWGRTLYPEGEVLWFNTILNKSKEYGTSPFHWYFTSALPRALLGAYPLALLSLQTVKRARALVAIPMLYVFLFSALPHKELRFVLYAVPPLNVAAAAAIAKAYASLPSRKANLSFVRRQIGLAGFMTLVTLLQTSCVASGLFAAAAYANYPGGRALEAIHRHADRTGAARGSRPLHVHIGVDAAMSGVSRFLERSSGPFRYSKKEGLKEHEYSKFTYALVAHDKELPGFSQAHVESGFDRIVPRPPFFTYAPKIKVLRRKKEGAGKAAAAAGGGGGEAADDGEETFFGDV